MHYLIKYWNCDICYPWEIWKRRNWFLLKEWAGKWRNVYRAQFVFVCLHTMRSSLSLCNQTFLCWLTSLVLRIFVVSVHCYQIKQFMPKLINYYHFQFEIKSSSKYKLLASKSLSWCLANNGKNTVLEGGATVFQLPILSRKLGLSRTEIRSP